MGAGTGAPLSGGPLHADLDRLYRIPLAEETLPGALHQADPPADTSEPVPAAAPGHGLDPVELTERALERIAATDGELRAWALVDADGARAQAETARARAERGNPGPLHGLRSG